jgi:transposase
MLFERFPGGTEFSRDLFVEQTRSDQREHFALALFAERMRPAPRRLPDAQELELKALVARSRQLVEMLTAERNRPSSAPNALRKELAAHIRWLEARLKKRDRDLDRMLRPSTAHPGVTISVTQALNSRCPTTLAGWIILAAALL